MSKAASPRSSSPPITTPSSSIPAGQAINGRDADRILAAAKKAGLARIDFVLLTHYHIDHTGGVPQLTDRIPVGTFIDHGPLREPGDKPTATAYDAYQKVLATGKYKHILAKPGMMLPIPGLTAEILTADGNFIDKPLPGAGQPNPFCKDSEPRPADQTENARSVGTSSPGASSASSTSAISPGIRKWTSSAPITASATSTSSSSPTTAGIKAPAPRWSMPSRRASPSWITAPPKADRSPPSRPSAKFPASKRSGSSTTPKKPAPATRPEPFIANLHGPDTGYGLELTVSRSGSFSVYNARTQKTTSYAAH